MASPRGEVATRPRASTGKIETFARSDVRRQAYVKTYPEEDLDFPDAQYHNQAWVLDPERRIMAMLGIHGQFSYVDLTSDLLIAGFGSFPTQTHAVLDAAQTQLWKRVTAELT